MMALDIPYQRGHVVVEGRPSTVVRPPDVAGRTAWGDCAEGVAATALRPEPSSLSTCQQGAEASPSGMVSSVPSFVMAHRLAALCEPPQATPKPSRAPVWQR
jgi:hypothetical protein